MTRNHKLIFLLVFTALFITSGCGRREKTTSRHFPAMGTQASIIMPLDSAIAPGKAAEKAAETMRNLENLWSIFKPESEMSHINNNAGIKTTRVSQKTIALLAESMQIKERSEGAFDITVGPLVQAWGFNGGTMPTQSLPPARIEELLEKTGSEHIILSESSVFLEYKGMALDPGGIAKGAAVDECVKTLAKTGVTDVLVNLGGNMRCIGSPGKGKPWLIGVQNPFDSQDVIGTIRLANGMAVATSGNYERFVIIDGERHCHIINPATGWPAQGIAGVTVLCESATAADAWSTAFFAAGLKAATHLIARSGTTGVMLIPDKQPIEIWLSPGLKNLFTPERKYKNRIFIIGENNSLPST